MNTPPRSTGRSAGQVAKRELDQLRADIMNQFSETRKEIQAMLPREIYEVRQRQVTDDQADQAARLAKLETQVIDLGAQVTTMRTATPQQISSSAIQMRADAMAKAVEMGTRVVFMLGGALLTFIAYYLGNHLR